MTGAYAGDVSPAEAWTLLNQDGRAVLIDVRTEPEWRYVGIADLATLNRQSALISWQVYPSMEINPGFIEEISGVAPDKKAPVFFLCRSGARSRSAAIAATAAGYAAAFNVAEGFEGDLNQEGRRGRTNGWKVHGLPWRQG